MTVQSPSSDAPCPPEDATPNDTRHHLGIHALVGIFLLALILRLLNLWQLHDAPVLSILMGDSAAYDRWALGIAAGDWLGSEVFYQAPLYPYFLGTLYWLGGHNLLWVRIVQVLMGSAACAILGSAGALWFHRRVGIVAGVAAAIYPSTVFFDIIIQKSVLDLFFACSLLAILGLLWRRRTFWPWLGCGALLGLFALTRENALGLTPLLLIWIALAFGDTSRRRRLAYAALLLAGMMLVLFPVAARNKVVGDEWHLTTSQFGPNFYIGNNPTADGGYREMRAGRGDALYERTDATELAQAAMGRELTPAEVSQYWTRQSLDYIREQPGHWLGLMWRKWMLVWNAVEMGDTEDQYAYGLWSWHLGLGSFVLHYGVLVPLAAWGIFVTRQRWRELWILYAIGLGYALSITLFFIFARYRYPLTPLLLLFGAAALCHGARYHRQHGLRAALGGGIVVLAAAVLSNWPLNSPGSGAATTLTNIAFRLEDRGEDKAALDTFRRAASIYRHPQPLMGMARLLDKSGKHEAALRTFREAVDAAPGDAPAHDALGSALLRSGKPQEALKHFSMAVQLDPGYADSHLHLGQLLARGGKNQAALVHLQQAATLAPDNAEAQHALAVVLAAVGRFEEAANAFALLTQLSPQRADAHLDLGLMQEKLGRNDAATRSFETAMNLDPTDGKPRAHLAMLLAARGQQERAVALLREAIALERAKGHTAQAQEYEKQLGSITER